MRSLAAERLAGLALLALAAWVAFETRRLPIGTAHGPGPGYMPLLLAAILAAFAVALAIRGGGARLGELDWAEAPHALAILAACVFAAAAIEPLGYRITITALLFFLFGAVQRRNPFVALLLAAGLAFATHWMFDTALKVPLPRGPLGL